MNQQSDNASDDGNYTIEKLDAEDDDDDNGSYIQEDIEEMSNDNVEMQEEMTEDFEEVDVPIKKIKIQKVMTLETDV